MVLNGTRRKTSHVRKSICATKSRLVASLSKMTNVLNGNQRLYDIGCMLWDLMVSEEMARKLVWEIFNPHCRPPWGSQDTSFVTALGRAYNGGAGNDNPGTKGHADPNFVFRAYLASGAARLTLTLAMTSARTMPRKAGRRHRGPILNRSTGQKKLKMRGSSCRADCCRRLPKHLIPGGGGQELQPRRHCAAALVHLWRTNAHRARVPLHRQCRISAISGTLCDVNASTLSSGKSLLINTARAPMKVIQLGA